MTVLGPLLIGAIMLYVPNDPTLPPTERIPVQDELHGATITDPYRWLEGSAAPELEGEQPELDEKVRQWTLAQNAYTRNYLDHIEGRSQFEQELGTLLSAGSISLPTVVGHRYFYTKRQGNQAQEVLFVRESLKGEARILIDPNRLDPSGLLTLDYYVPSPDGALVAFGTYHSGDENTRLNVLRVSDGTWLADEINGKVVQVAWAPDSKSFKYRCLASLDNPYSGQIKFHHVGQHHSQDRLLFEQYKEGPLATTWGPFSDLSSDGHWLTLMYYTGTDANDLWVVDMDHWQRTGEFVKQTVLEGEKALSYGTFAGGKLFMHTTLNAPNGQVVAVDPHKPGRDHWQIIIPESKDAVLETFQLARGMVVAKFMKNAQSHIHRYGLDGEDLGAIALPAIGTATLSTNPWTREAFLQFSSYNESDSIYHLDLTAGKLELWERPELGIDPKSVNIDQVWYSSKDGTKVSMFIIYPKGMKKNKKNPTILYGYGGFNVSKTPEFSAFIWSWVHRGGILAVANLRGGGEYGEDWHRAGMLDKKQNVFDDFIAAAQWLIDQKYTDRKHLGIYGGSNGGLLTGAALVQRPDLFGAVVSAVPLLDMLRYQNFLMARYWVPEYGSSEDAEAFHWLKAYSPYHNVNQGTAYPATLFTAGEHDTRVHALHAKKMAAAVQWASSADPSANPILLFVEQEAGHGQGKPIHLRIRATADVLSFFKKHLGM